eukprot:9480158-Pyramimonas_sp.AAC.2
MGTWCLSYTPPLHCVKSLVIPSMMVAAPTPGPPPRARHPAHRQCRLISKFARICIHIFSASHLGHSERSHGDVCKLVRRWKGGLVDRDDKVNCGCQRPGQRRERAIIP